MLWMPTHADRPAEAKSIHLPLTKAELECQNELARAGYQSVPIEVKELGPSPEQLDAIRTETYVPSVLLGRNQGAIWALSLGTGLMTMTASSIPLSSRRRQNPELPKALEGATYAQLAVHHVTTNS
eukprot:3964919-Amphidinium_carterae.1